MHFLYTGALKIPIFLIPKALNFCYFVKRRESRQCLSGLSVLFSHFFSENSSFKKSVIETLLFHSPKDIYIQGRNKGSIFCSDKFTSKVHILVIYQTRLFPGLIHVLSKNIFPSCILVTQCILTELFLMILLCEGLIVNWHIQKDGSIKNCRPL